MGKITLVVSDDNKPVVQVAPGMQFEVKTVSLVDGSMPEHQQKVAARLCGGTGTCLALVEIDPPSHKLQKSTGAPASEDVGLFRPKL